MVYRNGEQPVHRAPSRSTSVSLVTFALAGMIASPVFSEVLVRIVESDRGSKPGPSIHVVKEVDTFVWAATDEGLFQVSARSLLRRYPRERETPVDVTSIEKVGAETWFGSVQGLFRIHDSGYQPIDGHPLDASVHVTSILYQEEIESVWVGTSYSGVYRRSLTTSGSGFDHFLDNQGIITLSLVDGRVWAGTRGNIYYFDGAAKDFVPAAEYAIGNISKVLGVSGKTYLLSGSRQHVRSLYEWEGIGRIDTVETEVFGIGRVGGELWFGQERNIARRVNGVNQIVFDLGKEHGVFSSIREIDGVAWLATTLGLFRRDVARRDRPFEALAMQDDFSFSVKDVYGTTSGVLAWSQGNLYRHVSDIDMHVVFDSIHVDDFEMLLLKRSLKVQDVQYLRSDRTAEDLHDTNLPIDVILKKDKASFEEAIDSVPRDYGNIDTDLDFGVTEVWGRVYAAVRDANGNVERVEGRVVVIINLETLVPAVLLLLYAASVVVLFMYFLPGILLRFALLIVSIPNRIFPRPGRILLAQEWARRSIQKLYMSRWEHEDDGYKLPEDLKGLASSLSVGSVTAIQEPKGGAKPVLRGMAREAMQSSNGGWRYAIPVFVEFGNMSSGGVSQEPIRTALQGVIQYVDSKFIDNLLRYGSFIFLFAGSGSRSDAEDYVANFASTSCQRSHVVVAYTDDEPSVRDSEREESSSQLPDAERGSASGPGWWRKIIRRVHRER